MEGGKHTPCDALTTLQNALQAFGGVAGEETGVYVMDAMADLKDVGYSVEPVPDVEPAYAMRYDPMLFSSLLFLSFSFSFSFFSQSFFSALFDCV